MDILSGNPEIGQELIQLLYAKLKQKRQELEELRRAVRAPDHRTHTLSS